MKKEDLIAQCRYYRGEDECPYNEEKLHWFWDMERVWVGTGGDFVGETPTYKTYGGRKYPGIPFTLLMVMFTSWGKYAYDFKTTMNQFYELVDYYLEIPSDYFPKDEIPGKVIAKEVHKK